MAQRLSQLATLVVVTACVGCDRPPTAPAPGGLASDSASVRATPPIRGVVRETNGGPIAGVTVRLVGSKQVSATSWVSVAGPTAMSDGAGVFVLPASTDVCQSDRAAGLAVQGNYRWSQPSGIACTSAVNPPEVTVEVKGQRFVTVGSGAPLVIPLSNDDLDLLAYGQGYDCGPCRMVGLGYLPLGQPAVIRVEWSGPDPIHLWVEGECCIDRYGDIEQLREMVPSPGQTTMTLTVPVEWRPFYLYLKVGLPYGGRFPAGSPPVSVRIEVMG